MEVSSKLRVLKDKKRFRDYRFGVLYVFGNYRKKITIQFYIYYVTNKQYFKGAGWSAKINRQMFP